MLYPDRFRTGIRNTTIVNPAALYRGKDHAEVFEGVVGDYQFNMQSSNFLKIQKVLSYCGLELGPIAAATYKVRGGWSERERLRNLTRFVACDTKGLLMWEKYEGTTAGGGRNSIYLAGYHIKTTDFLELDHGVVAETLLWNQPLPWSCRIVDGDRVNLR